MRDYIVTELQYEEGRFTAAALYDDRVLKMLRIEPSGGTGRVGMVFRGCVENVAENIGGAFIRDGRGEMMFLPLKKAKHAHSRADKANRIRGSQPVLVQIRKEASGLKEAVVSDQIEIAGRYAVVSMKPGKTSFSSKLTEEQKTLLRKWTAESPCPEFGVLIRTNAARADKQTLLEEIRALAERLRGILDAYGRAETGAVLYRPEPFYIEAARDLYEPPERWFSDVPLYREKLAELAAEIGGTVGEPAESLQRTLTLAELYDLPENLKRLMQKKVWLKSGAFIVIEKTEAFVSIDVNTGRSVKGKIPEETYRRVNLEAAQEIARQMALRNLSGMILVDFISLDNPDHQEELVGVMKKLVKKDPVYTEVVDLTPLGIMEIVRRKVRKPLAEVLSLC